MSCVAHAAFQFVPRLPRAQIPRRESLRHPCTQRRAVSDRIRTLYAYGKRMDFFGGSNNLLISMKISVFWRRQAI